MNTVGGGVYLRGNTSLHSTSSYIADCKFIGNAAGIGGALYLGAMDSVHISDSEFIDNSATLLGGAIDIMQTNTNIINCNFTQNNASYGGGISIYLKRYVPPPGGFFISIGIDTLTLYCNKVFPRMLN